MLPAALLAEWANQFDERFSQRPLELPLDLLPPLSDAVRHSSAAALMLEVAIYHRRNGFSKDVDWLKCQLNGSAIEIASDDVKALLRGLFTSEMEARRRVAWVDFQQFGFTSEELKLAGENDHFCLGQVLWDSTVLRERIAEGGVAVVYRAETFNQTSIAIKVPKKLEGVSNDPFSEAIRHEARVLSHLEVDGVPKLLEFREWNSIPVLAMEWIASPYGAGFPEHATRDEKLLSISKLARIVDRLHRRDLIHGDIKSHNFTIDQDQRVWLLDFNVTRSALPEDNPDGPLPGTRMMMSPESLVGVSADADISQDVHALGSLTYEAMTGRPPHQQSERNAALVASILTGGKHELEYPEGTPESLRLICRIAISRHVHQRFATAEDFAKTLDRFLTGDLVLDDIPPRRPQIVAWRLGDALGRCLTRTRRLIEQMRPVDRDPTSRLTKSEAAALGYAMGISLAIEEIVMLNRRIDWPLPPPPNDEVLSSAFYRARTLTAGDLPSISECAREIEDWFRSTWRTIQEDIAPKVPTLFLLTATSLQARFSEGSSTARETWNKLASHAKLPCEAVTRFDRALCNNDQDVAWEKAVRRLDYDVMQWLRWESI